MEYKIKDLCNTFNFGVSKFYKLKKNLDNSIPEQNRMEYYFNKGRNFYITEKGFAWFKSNLSKDIKTQTVKENNSTNLSLYQDQLIEVYKQRIAYLENENKRLLDIISVKEQKELARDFKMLGDTTNSNFGLFSKIFRRFNKGNS